DPQGGPVLDRSVSYPTAGLTLRREALKLFQENHLSQSLRGGPPEFPSFFQNHFYQLPGRRPAGRRFHGTRRTQRRPSQHRPERNPLCRPPTLPTKAPQGTPGTTTTNVSQGAPPSTSQQGTVNTTPA